VYRRIVEALRRDVFTDPMVGGGTSVEVARVWPTGETDALPPQKLTPPGPVLSGGLKRAL